MIPRTVAFCTLGCKVNQYDSQAMLERFEDAGYRTAPFSSPADVYVINTCTVTGTGDKKSRQMIRRAHRNNPDAAIVVTGCLAQRAAEALLLPGVRLVLGTQRRAEIVTLLQSALCQATPVIAVAPLIDTPFEPLSIRRSEGRTRASLKIQEGCENHCAYCVIPSVRGPVRSRPLEAIRMEAQNLAQAGFQEIVVTGIHLSSYGRDSSATLLDALRILQETDGIQRIRLGSLEPGIITPPFVASLRTMDRICPQFMLALQSGSDSVLARMGRRYTTDQYRQAADSLRQAYPRAALTTDIMAGFPGETVAEFEQTLAFVEAMRFSRIHVFPYSRREGTRAAAMPKQVDRNTRESRAAALIALGSRLEQAYLQTWIGQSSPVLFEEEANGGATGYTPEYIRVLADGAPGKIERTLLSGILSLNGEPALSGRVHRPSAEGQSNP